MGFTRIPDRAARRPTLSGAFYFSSFYRQTLIYGVGGRYKLPVLRVFGSNIKFIYTFSLTLRRRDEHAFLSIPLPCIVNVMNNLILGLSDSSYLQIKYKNLKLRANEREMLNLFTYNMPLALHKYSV